MPSHRGFRIKRFLKGNFLLKIVIYMKLTLFDPVKTSYVGNHKPFFFLFLKQNWLLMKTYLFVTTLISLTLCWNTAVKAQESVKVSTPESLTSDKIAFVWGDTLKVNIRKIESDYVTYSLVGERMKQKTQKTNITSIIYKDGKVESFSNPLIKKKLNDGASKIKVTHSEDDVMIYRIVAEVEGRYVGSERFSYSNAFLERMAIDNLKEIAYRNDPSVKILLVKKVSITRGYGEGPSAVVTAVAYTR